MSAARPAPEPGVIYLVPLAGPALPPLCARAKPDGLTIGRQEQCDLRLPVQADTVSRLHARLRFDDSGWHVADLGSRWGTFVNGMKLSPEQELPLREGDLLRITPWTFTVTSTPRPRGVRAQEDGSNTIVQAVTSPGGQAPLAESMLNLLLETASAVGSAADEIRLAEVIMDAAVRGTGLPNAFVLRPLDAEGHLQVVASRMPGGAGLLSTSDAPASFSRSLINLASTGVVAEIGPADGPISQSMVQLRISSALCVPMVLGSASGTDDPAAPGAGSVAAYLYLDARGTQVVPARAGAGAFCVALGRLASLALANLKRLEMEKRQSQMEAEFVAAAAAQKWIMPARQADYGQFHTIGESRPGQFVGGDFFDLIPLADGRLAVALADVAGKGIAASVLMTATQGFLHAALREHQEAGQAATALNQYICPRRPEGKFITLWIGIFDAQAQTLCYVDAGHSYALLQRRDGTIEQLDQGGGLPIGIETDSRYEAVTVPFAAGDRVLVVSDGLIEQFGMVATETGPQRRQFEIEGVKRSLIDSAGQAAGDPVAAVFYAVVRHAATHRLADDATAVLVCR